MHFLFLCYPVSIASGCFMVQTALLCTTSVQQEKHSIMKKTWGDSSLHSNPQEITHLIFLPQGRTSNSSVTLPGAG